ncbi:unnamed protein product [Closterium sp. NIES-54]
MIKVSGDAAEKRNELPPSKIEALDGSNYEEWSRRMRSAFKHYKLLKLAMGEEKMPEEGDARDRWIEKSAVLYDLILQSVNNDMLQHIKDLVELDDSGPKAWTLLRDVIQPNTLPMVIVLEKELAALSMRPGDDVKPVIDKIKDTYARMAAAGSNVSQMQQCTKIISVLDNSWDNLIPTLNTLQDQWTPEWLRQQILQEDLCRHHTGGGAANKTAEGYGAVGGSRGRGGGRGRGRGRGFGRGRGRGDYNEGHGSSGGRGSTRMEGACWYCKKAGHPWFKCFSRPEGWAPPGMKPPSGERARGAAVQGSGAQGDGAHGKADPGMFLMVEDVRGSESDVGSVGKVVMHPLTHWVIDSGALLPVIGVGNAKVMGANGGLVELGNVLLVEGLSANLLSVRRLQKSKAKVTFGPTSCRAKLGKLLLWDLEKSSCIKDLWQLPIILWNGKLPATAAAAATAKATAGGEETALKWQIQLQQPRSQMKAAETGACGGKGGGTAAVGACGGRPPGEQERSAQAVAAQLGSTAAPAAQQQQKVKTSKVASGSAAGGSTGAEGGIKNVQQPQQPHGEVLAGVNATAAWATASSGSGESDWETWHERLCHVNFPMLQKLVKDGSLKGLKVKGAVKEIGSCPTYLETNFTKFPFSSGTGPAKAPLPLVNMDVVGPTRAPSLSVSHYFLTIMDNHTRAVWVYPLKTKGEVAAAVLKEWMQRAQRESGHKVKIIRTDNGGEFIGADFEAVLKKKGIQHQLTVPYNPQQNGVAERFNRTLQEGARTLLGRAGLPDPFWVTALWQVAFVKNRVLATVGDKQWVPYTKWYGSAPAVSMLRAYGYMVVFHVPKEKRGKLEASGRWGVHLGLATYGHKYGPDGELTRYKSRLVAKGFQQTKGEDFDEIFAPVGKGTTLRVMLGTAANRGWRIKKMDITTAFLNGIILEELYMLQPEGLDDGSGRVCRLKKAIYGLKQAPRAWYHKLEETLLAGGFKKSKCDHSLFLLQEKEQFLMLLVYVDDNLLFAESSAMIERVEEMLEMQFKCLKMGDVKYYLGMHVEGGLDKGVLRLHQRKCCEGLAEKYGLQDGGKPATPLPSASVGLEYSAVRQRQQRGAADLGKGEMLLTCYTNASFNSVKADGTSIGGYVCMFGGGAVRWRSKKQNEVGLSSCETEYMALHHGAKEVVMETMLVEVLAIGVMGALVVEVVIEVVENEIAEVAELEAIEGAALSGGPAGDSPRLSPQQLCEWLVRRARLQSGATGARGAGAARARGAEVTAGAGGSGGTAATGPGGARTRGTGTAGTGGVGGARAGHPTELGAAGAGGSCAGGAGARGAGGAGQRQGVDYFLTYSPTPKMTTLRVLLHVAAQRDYELHSLDFSTDFPAGQPA